MSALDASNEVVLLVDDTPDNLVLMSELLCDKYRVKVANNGERALKIALSESPPDLILLDIMMPGMDGYEVCKRLKANPLTAHIPVIFLTAMSEQMDEQIGLELGAADYITKPVSPPIMLARVRNNLAVKAAADFLRDKSAYLEVKVAERTQELAAIQDVTILAMASLAEIRDVDTGNHVRRTQYYVKALAEHLAEHPRFSSFLTPENVKLIFKSAPLHDIGKVGIPDHILLKQGRYAPHEFEIMKQHPSLGRQAIEQAEQVLGVEVSFLRFAKDIAQSHHEKWDGSGYPQGLAGEEIPIPARLMALADVYDALISRRIYKPGLTHEQAKKIICDGTNSHFDPDVINAFLEIEEQFQAIARQYADNDSDLANKFAQQCAFGLYPSVSTDEEPHD